MCYLLIWSLILFFTQFDDYLSVTITTIELFCFAVFYLYTFVYRFNQNKTARLLDSLVGDNRVSTMIEIEDEHNLMADMQRADTLKRIEKIPKKSLKIKIKKIQYIPFCILLILTILMCSLVSLKQTDSWSGLSKKKNQFSEDGVFIKLTYLSNGGGVLMTEDGKKTMSVRIKVKKGNDAPKIRAIADPGYVFHLWTDVKGDADRKDKNVTEEIHVRAVFLHKSVLDDAFKSDDNDEDSGAKGGASDNKGGTGRYESENQIIDGSTFYRDILDDEYRKEIDKSIDDKDIDDKEKEIIGDYFEILK